MIARFVRCDDDLWQITNSTYIYMSSTTNGMRMIALKLARFTAEKFVLIIVASVSVACQPYNHQHTYWANWAIHLNIYTYTLYYDELLNLLKEKVNCSMSYSTQAALGWTQTEKIIVRCGVLPMQLYWWMASDHFHSMYVWNLIRLTTCMTKTATLIFKT